MTHDARPRLASRYPVHATLRAVAGVPNLRRRAARILRTPREVRNAICYVLQQTRRHETTERVLVDPAWIDPRSSAAWFDGWRGGPVAPPSAERPPAAPATTWLLRDGWRRHGLIRIDEVPPAALA